MGTMRAPFLEARVNVVLFREAWGNTPWTRVEDRAGRPLFQGRLGVFDVRRNGRGKAARLAPSTQLEEHGAKRSASVR